MPVFVDTNVLIYALDPRDPKKQRAAQEWLTRCWQDRSGRVSVQVLNEFYVNIVRLNGESFRAQARAEAKNFMAWHPHAIDAATLESAWHIADHARVSHWDALILASAAQQGCEMLLSEDMQHNQVIEGVRIVNPFLHGA